MGAVALALGLVAARSFAGTDAPAEAERLYWSGRAIDAAGVLETALDGTSATGERLPLLEQLLDLCASARLGDCLAKWGPRYAELLHSTGAIGLPRARRLARVLALERMLAGDFATIETMLSPRGMPDFVDPDASPETYAEMQLIAAEVAQRRGRIADSQLAVARAVSALLSMGSGDRIAAARLLLAVAERHAANHDLVKALAIEQLGEPLFAAAFPPESLEQAELLRLQAALKTHTSLGRDAIAALQAAIAATGRVQFDPQEKGFWLAIAAARLAAMQVLQGDVDGARATLAAHPLAARRDALVRAGRFADFPALAFAVAEVFVAAAAGEPPNPAWKPDFEAPLQWDATPDVTAWGEAYRQFGRGLLLADSDPAAAQAGLFRAARARIEAIGAQLGEGWDAFLLVEDVDRMLLDRALSSAARQPSPDAGTGDLMLAAAELLNRNLRYGEGEALSVVSAQPDERSRRLAQTALRMAGQQAAWERRRLSALVQVMLATDAHARLPQAGQLREQMATFLRARRDVAAALDARSGYGAAKRGLPRLAELQAALRPDEAFLVHVPTLEGLARICIRSDGIRGDLVAADRRAVLADARLLQAALTSPNPPSEALDRQYPVAAAQRMYALLIGGLEDCLTPGSRIVYAPAPELDGLPLAALLRAAPPTLGDGYDLAQAHWVALDYAIAYADSARGFLAARQASRLAARGRGADIAFLGIGDPALAPVAGARSGGERLVRRSAPAAAGALAGLPELPETADELRAIGALFPGSAQLLLGARATETEVRLRRLSRYAILHFATHGLIRDDLPGLSEAALVLTPEANGEDSGDGLLTASELAALRLNAQLVVLSACNTARFDTSLFAGDVQGLSAALAVAGVPAVVASLWPVESATTQRLMAAFYGRLRSGGGEAVSDALADAVRQTIAAAPSPAFRHPRFWAPFILLGDGASTMSLAPGLGVEGATFTDDDATAAEVSIMAAVPAQDGGSLAAVELAGAGERSVLKLHAPSGAVVWRQPADAAAVQALAASSDGFFLAEHLDGVGAPMLSAIGMDGTPRWQRSFELGGHNGSITAMSATPDGGVVAVAAADGGPDGWGTLTVVRLDRDGVEKRRFVLQSSGAASDAVRLALRGDEVLLAIGTSARPQRQFFQLDDFHLPRLCWKDGQTRLVLLDLETLAMQRERVVAGIAAAGVAPAGDGWLVAGTSWQKCAASGRGFAAKVSPELQVDEVWRDDGPLPSRATGAVAVAGGYAIVGSIEAALTLPEPDVAGTPRGPVAAARGIDDGGGQAAAGQTEAFLLRLAPDGSADWQFADAGLATRLDGVAAVAGGALGYGSIGGLRALWMSVPGDRR